jgi:hypothetical protein
VDAGLEPPTCGREPPEPPDGVPPGVDVGPLLFAIRGVVLDQHGMAHSWSDTGYDLDCFITNSPRDVLPDQAECVPPNALPPPIGGFTVDEPPEPLSLDGQEGIDNVFGDKFYSLLASVIADELAGAYPDWDDEDGARPLTLENVVREEQLGGKGTLLVGFEGWNGQFEDPQMTAWIAQAVGGTPCTQKDLVEFNRSRQSIQLRATQWHPGRSLGHQRYHRVGHALWRLWAGPGGSPKSARQHGRPPLEPERSARPRSGVQRHQPRHSL